MASLSKSLRFEIFKRDGFTCQYCGQRPPGVVLEVDHINPRANGGSDDILNLVTSCYDCNRGKSDKKLGDVVPRPDADLQFLEAQQELAEMHRYASIKADLDKARESICGMIQDTWSEYLTKDIVPNTRVIVPWIKRYGPDEIEAAIIIAGQAYAKNRFGYDDERAFNKMIPYIGAVLRNRSIDKENV